MPLHRTLFIVRNQIILIPKNKLETYSVQRQKAVEIMKEIANSCKLLNPKTISLEPTNEAGHFEIHVEGHVDDENWQCLKELAKKHDLGIKLTDHTMVIYVPVGKNIGKLMLS